jgi:NADH:ubiquinone oxidoreductase subunit 5 (subunit L)/multisubunit Na+/H+ antiporter MnhA subunit
MPVTGGSFLLGSAAIRGLPPLNGFVSEWLIYIGLFRGMLLFHGLTAGVCVVGIVSLAFIGGLAAACFAKAFSVVFLGQPRSKLPGGIHEAGKEMRLSMLIGAALCLLIGLWPEGAVHLVSPLMGTLAAGAPVPTEIPGALAAIARSALVLIALVAFFSFVRHRLLRGKEIRSALTWGCGYGAPTGRMQYTASSFAQPLLQSLGTVLKQTRRVQLPQGYFPASGHFSEHLADRSLEHFWVPSALRTVSLFRRLKFLQQGRLQSYILYILITMILLLLWNAR